MSVGLFLEQVLILIGTSVHFRLEPVSFSIGTCVNFWNACRFFLVNDRIDSEVSSVTAPEITVI